MKGPFVPVNYPRFRRYMTHGVLEELHSGMRWTEGPVWFADTQTLYFSDIPASRIYRWVEGQGVSILRAPSDKANGMSRDRQGRLITCESGARRVTRTELNGDITVLADKFEGKRLNSPNDIVASSDGSVWFTDPDYGILSDYTGFRAESEIGANNVYRVAAATNEISLAASGLEKPNGLAFSPDERILYVADSGRTHKQDGAHHVMAFDVGAHGALSNKRAFAEIEVGVPDGMRVDFEGNVWVATVEAGISVFAPDGELIGRIELPDPVANLTFGGPQMNRLFITAGTKLYSLFTGSRGISMV